MENKVEVNVDFVQTGDGRGAEMAPPPPGGMQPPKFFVNGGPPPPSSKTTSLSVPTPGGLFPLKNSPQLQSSSATGNPRNKVGLEKGFSLMDWVRLTKSGKDLSGVGGPRINGKVREITKAELRKHKKRKDAWIALNGAVYNITPYMDFHPGGWDELIKGAGRDATDLFNEVHRWVNYEGLLAACLVGKLVDRPSGEAEAEEILQPVIHLPPPKQVIPPIPAKLVPSFDFFQTERTVTINLYSRRKDLMRDSFIVDNFQDSIRVVCIFPDKTGFIFHHQLTDRVESTAQVRVGAGAKLEINLVKQIAVRWQGLGTPLQLNSWFGDLKDMQLTYRGFRVHRLENCTHNTLHLVLQPVHSTQMTVPPGHHVHLRGEVSGLELVRSYTPVVPLGEGEGEADSSELHFLIKIYPDGAFTPFIGALRAGDEINVSDHTGTFHPSQLQGRDRVYLLAAGTGITPILRILPLLKETETILLYFNKTEQDIIWREELASFAANNSWLSIEHVLSDQPTYKGRVGRVSSDLLAGLVSGDQPSRYACICGPSAFTALADRILKEDFLFTEEEIHLFKG